ncbi:MAG: YopX family protein [Lachnospiraceae bacterium]|nr:YopX family protein [Lachnospiraceae bacterium]
MNKEIKFRGKRLDNGEWVYGHYSDYIHPDCGIPRPSIIYTLPNCGNMIIAVDPSTVGQFTGLKAEGDEELYKGDIVEICRFDHNGTDHYYIANVDFYMGEFILCVTHRVYYQWKNNELHKTVSKYKENEAAPCWSLSEMYIGCCYPDGTIGNCEDIKIVGNIHEQSKKI